MKTEVPWGLPMHLDIPFFADLAARNIVSSIDVDDYLDYVPVGIVSENKLPAFEINALLSRNRNLKDLFDYAIGQGYVFLTRSSSKQTSVTIRL